MITEDVWKNIMDRMRIIIAAVKIFLFRPKFVIDSFSIYKIKRLCFLLFRASKIERDRVISRALNINVEYDCNARHDLPKVDEDSRRFPVFDTVDISIIIPVYNQWSLTDSCLRSIISTTNNLRYEVILADDASSDKTQMAEEIFCNLNVIRNSTNLGFLHNCNNAAKYAKGRYLVILNNDTIVHDYWLEALADKMDKDHQIAICGSKLVYPDGRLQEAGGIIWNDASGWNYGRMDSPAKPEYCYCKEVDYISGASIMIRRSFWDEVGGFDERYAPAYYEDTDLAFEAASRGYKVVFHPHSVVTHFEGQSHGTDEAFGIKTCQTKNRLKFKDKWKSKLEKECFQNGEHIFQARDKSKNKRAILVIDHYVPWFDKDAGSRSTYMYLQLFLELGYNVKFMGDNFFPHQPYTDYLNEIGVEVLHGQEYANNWKSWVKLNAQYLDVVYLHRPHIAPKYINFFRKNTSAKIVYQCHDLHHIRIRRDFKNSGDISLQKEAMRLEKIEKDIFNSVDIGLTFSHDEKLILDSYSLKAEIRQVPLYLYDNINEQNTFDFQEREGLLFVGGFNHKPNEEGVNWFLQEIYPRVIEKLPASTFYIVGSNIPKSISDLTSKNIVVSGFVSDSELSRLYRKVKVCILPLLHGAGVKGKLVEAMQYKTPVVSTTIGIEGINARLYEICGYDSPDDFLQELIQLLTDENYWLDAQNAFIKAYSSEFSKSSFKQSCKEIF